MPAGRGPLGLVRAVPWAIALDLAAVLNSHWHELSESDRSKLTDLIRKSRGNPANLTRRDRDEALKIVRRLDFAAMARDLLPFAGRARRR